MATFPDGAGQAGGRPHAAATLRGQLAAHVEAVTAAVDQCEAEISAVIGHLLTCFRAGNKLLLCGNGGSAADAQHMAGEFVNRFRFDRPGLPAIALTTDSSVLTCIANDASFDRVFARQVEALGRPGDVLAGFSTSGGSRNVLAAMESGRRMGLVTLGFTGRLGHERMGGCCDVCLPVPSADTPRIQEAHEFLWHVICGAVEEELFGASRAGSAASTAGTY